ncbi:hypothetical protein GCM10027024_27330 [Microbacterium insulae]
MASLDPIGRGGACGNASDATPAEHGRQEADGLCRAPESIARALGRIEGPRAAENPTEEPTP